MPDDMPSEHRQSGIRIRLRQKVRFHPEREGGREGTNPWNQLLASERRGGTAPPHLLSAHIAFWGCSSQACTWMPAAGLRGLRGSDSLPPRHQCSLCSTSVSAMLTQILKCACGEGGGPRTSRGGGLVPRRRHARGATSSGNCVCGGAVGIFSLGKQTKRLVAPGNLSQGRWPDPAWGKTPGGSASPSQVLQKQTDPFQGSARLLLRPAAADQRGSPLQGAPCALLFLDRLATFLKSLITFKSKVIINYLNYPKSGKTAECRQQVSDVL